MPHWRTMIEKDFLGAWDMVDANGKPRDYTLKISKVESKLLKTRTTPKGKRKCTVTFEKARKQFVANATNCETIESMYGGDTDGWVGRSITLYQTTTRNPSGSGTVACIRVRSRVPTEKAEGIVERPVDPEMRAAQDEAYGREPGEEG